MDFDIVKVTHKHLPMTQYFVALDRRELQTYAGNLACVLRSCRSATTPEMTYILDLLVVQHGFLFILGSSCIADSWAARAASSAIGLDILMRGR